MVEQGTAVNHHQTLALVEGQLVSDQRMYTTAFRISLKPENEGTARRLHSVWKHG